MWLLNNTQFTKLKDSIFKADTIELVFDHKGGGKTSSITSILNDTIVSWTVKDKSLLPDWITISGEGTGTISVTIKENTKEEREAILNLMQEDTGKTIYIKIKQQPEPTPEYILEVPTWNNNLGFYSPYKMLPDVKEYLDLCTFNGRSYKRIGEEEIPVKVASSNCKITMSKDGWFNAEYFFDSRQIETTDESGLYVYTPEFHQAEDGGKEFSISCSRGTQPAVFPKEREVKIGYNEVKEHIVGIKIRHMPKSAYNITIDKEHTSPWIHAKGGMSEISFTCDKNFSPKSRKGSIVFSVDLPTPIKCGSKRIYVTQQEGNVVIKTYITDIIDKGLSYDKTRHLFNITVKLQMFDQQTGNIVNPDVPYKITGSDDRVKVENFDETKKTLLLSVDVNDKLDTPVTINLKLDEGSDLPLNITLDNYDLPIFK